MAKSIDKMSLDELKAHQKEVEAAVRDFAKKNRAEALKAAREAVKPYGVTLEEVMGGKAAKATGTKGAPKYAHPENPEMTWTGRGRQPNWVKEALASGKALEDMAI